METSTEVVGYIPLPFLFASERAGFSDFGITPTPTPAAAYFIFLLFFTALRPSLLDGEQDRLRLARLLQQRRTQTQDGADVQMQPGTAPPPLHSIVVPFRVLIPTWRCHTTTVIFSPFHIRRRYMKTAVC